MKLLARLTLTVAATALAAPAFAQFQKPEDAVKYRKSAFTVMGAHFSRIGAMASGKVPFNAASAAENAAVVEAMAKLPWAAFVAGSDMEEGTKAKAEVWSDAAGFKTAAEKMQAEVGKLNAAAKTGNLDAVKTAFGAAGQSCKACHDNYRAK